MIFDRIENWKSYYRVGIWRQAFEFIEAAHPEIEEGRHEIAGDELYADVQRYQTVGRQETVIEAHRKYMDIQLLLAGAEHVDCFFVSRLTELDPYSEERDVAFFRKDAIPPVRVTLGPGLFVGLLPQDAHSPKIAVEERIAWVKKIVLKLRMDCFE